MFDKKAYMKKWQQENKEKVNAYARNYYCKNKEKVKEKIKGWRENNLDKVKEYNKKGYEKFIKTHNWNKYVNERRKARVQRLREQGVKNPWAVINGKEAKYE